MIKILILLLSITLFGCVQKHKLKSVDKKCIVDSVYEVERSTLDINKRYSVLTDCGESITTKIRLKKGDTLLFIKKTN